MTATNPLPTPDAGGAGLDWSAVLVRHDRWLRTVVLARLGERQAVDEVMQEVSLAAVEQRAPLLDPGKVASWLYRLAIRKTLLYRRQRGRQQRLADRYARAVQDGKSEDAVGDPLRWLLRDERQQLVRRAIQRLPRRDAEILLLKYTENWSYRELAEHLGCSEGAVESRLHRVRQRLRGILTSLDGAGGREGRQSP